MKKIPRAQSSEFAKDQGLAVGIFSHPTRDDGSLEAWGLFTWVKCDSADQPPPPAGAVGHVAFGQSGLRRVSLPKGLFLTRLLKTTDFPLSIPISDRYLLIVALVITYYPRALRKRVRVMVSTQPLRALQYADYTQPYTSKETFQSSGKDPRPSHPPSSSAVYEGYKFFRADPIPGQKATWARVERAQMHLNQSGLSKTVRKRSNKVHTALQYEQLSNIRRPHVDEQLDERRRSDPGVKWSYVYAKECDGHFKTRSAQRDDFLSKGPITPKTHPGAPAGDLVDSSLPPDSASPVSMPDHQWKMEAQQEPCPLSEKQLIQEVRNIYAGLMMIVEKCIKIEEPELADRQWQALIASLRDDHHDFFMAPKDSPLNRTEDRQAQDHPPVEVSHDHALSNQTKATIEQRRIQFRNIILALKSVRPSEQWIDMIHFIENAFDQRHDHTIPQHKMANSNSERTSHETPDFEIPGKLGNHSIKALGDTGAKRNFIREQHAVRLRLPIDRSVTQKVVIGSGKEITTTGVVSAPFRFQEEGKVYWLEFHVLPKLIHNVILGKPFLKLTETLTNFANFSRRVKEIFAKRISQADILYLGDSGYLFEGSINGHAHTALADSGAKVLVMDEAYARSVGVNIHTGSEHTTRLRFADGSTVNTSGMAYGVDWRFGRDTEFTSPYRLDFHILRDSPANVILGGTFLYQNSAFSQYHRYLIDSDEDDDELALCAIDIDEKGRKHMIKKGIPCTIGNLEFLELIRRGEEDDRIYLLPRDQQAVAKASESQRRAEWDRTYADLKATDDSEKLQQHFAAAVAQLKPMEPFRSKSSGRKLVRKWLNWPRRGHDGNCECDSANV
ncbi:uncharacterized protein N7459_006987 [Penicillium hispanicum]|uniref:uncharacterized protein n=1 Tax=Penicillium hispanicum TaxID=1080232 RepID=UPI00254213F2|nr:uncharacterized protein N7459_006987 [Penicillium hispanicum]KAJ5578023.1 hypothetical protein N7459_006987 [Penicillium hispanicum]